MSHQPTGRGALAVLEEMVSTVTGVSQGFLCSLVKASELSSHFIKRGNRDTRKRVGDGYWHLTTSCVLYDVDREMGNSTTTGQSKEKLLTEATGQKERVGGTALAAWAEATGCLC